MEGRSTRYFDLRGGRHYRARRGRRQRRARRGRRQRRARRGRRQCRARGARGELICCADRCWPPSSPQAVTCASRRLTRGRPPSLFASLISERPEIGSRERMWRPFSWKMTPSADSFVPPILGPLSCGAPSRLPLARPHTASCFLTPAAASPILVPRLVAPPSCELQRLLQAVFAATSNL